MAGERRAGRCDSARGPGHDRQSDLREGRCRSPAARQRPVARLCGARGNGGAGAALDRHRAQPERGAGRRGRRLDPGLRLRLAGSPPLLRSRLRALGLSRRRPGALHLLDRLAAVRRCLAGGGLRARRSRTSSCRHGAGLRRRRQSLPDRHGGAAGPPARVLVPRPGCGAGRSGLCLSPLRVRRRTTQAVMTINLFPEIKLSLDALRAVQLERLKSVLSRAYQHQPPYRAKCQAAGVHPDDLHRLEDLQRFPFTSKADLRDAYPYGMLAIPREKCVRIHASSGTTGRPTVVGYSARDIETWAGVMARSLHAGGARPGDVVHNAYGYGLFTGGLGVHYGAERLGCTVVPMSGGFGERQLQLIAEFGARVVLMTPSYMLAIADEFERQGVDPRDTALRIGIFGAEPWTEGMRDEIERRLGIDAVDLYGLSEVMGPGGACEFVESKDGPTIWEDHFYPEVVDPDSGQPVPDGQPGELVFTTLTKEAMPVVRYRTRDLTHLMAGSRTAMRRMAKITGR